MNSANDISKELKNMGSILSGMPRTMPFAVPDGYFENFPGAVKSAVKDINEPDQVPGWSKTLPYAVPYDYFNTLAAHIVAAATAGDAASALPIDVPLSAPVGYFESFPVQMLTAAKATDRPKTIPLSSRSIFRQLRWAAAAILLLGIGLGSYEVFFKTNPNNPENILASVPSNDINDYLQHIYRVEDVDRIVSNTEVNNLQLDNNDIVQYLNETGWD